MPMDIPTYEVGEIDGSNLYIQYPYTSTMQGFANNIPVCDGARFYFQPIIIGNPSLMYGPGSVTYEIVKCETVIAGDIPSIVAIPIDPKTYIDNYGYVHIGKTNQAITVAPGLVAPDVRITFKTRYHYTNPSTGEEIVEESPENYFKVVAYDPTLDNEMLRSIPYAAAPSNSINAD